MWVAPRKSSPKTPVKHYFSQFQASRAQLQPRLRGGRFVSGHLEDTPTPDYGMRIFRLPPTRAYVINVNNHRQQLFHASCCHHLL
ncbi:hypothetical protein CDAR_511051 [Caerostris darwini]|uniref:Uncharacterized protein n=1 Tax=Caerostris darwini TaxID=1538125 RepID=A0AAV4S232_9ARAC|nr:hypothetical protein CDAR_511051 [Caerostris darwini]